MQYRTLPDDALRELRVQRVQALEADHYRVVLGLEEAPDDADAQARLVDIERRIAVHCDALEGGGRPEPGDPAQLPDVDGRPLEDPATVAARHSAATDREPAVTD